MLQNIRDRFTGPTALIVLGLIAIPFIFVGVSSPLLSAGFAAKVDGDEISLPLFENAWQNQVSQNPEIANYPPVYLNALRQQLLDRLIDERLFYAYLNSAGMRIADRMVTDQVQREPAFQSECRIDHQSENQGDRDRILNHGCTVCHEPDQGESSLGAGRPDDGFAGRSVIGWFVGFA